MQLYDFQEQDLQRILEALNNRLRVMYTLPTGGGKGVMMGELAARWLAMFPTSTVYWITHREELERQAWERLVVDHGIDHTRVQVISPIRAVNRHIPKFAAEEDLAILDEGHHSVANKWNEFIEQFPGYICACTATPQRLSKTEGFEDQFDTLIVGPSMRELIDRGFLAQPDVRSPSHGAIEGRGRNVSGDYSDKETWADSDNKALLVELAIDWLASYGQRRTICYTVGVEHSFALYEYATLKGFRAGVILGYDPKRWPSKAEYDAERIKTLNDFDSGEIELLINYAVVTEGVDVVACDTVLMLRKTLSLPLYLQMAGRPLRSYPGSEKRTALILDGANNFKIHGVPDDDRKWSLKPRGEDSNRTAPLKACARCEHVCHTARRDCPQCHAPFGRHCAVCGKFRKFEDYDGDASRCNICQHTYQQTAFSDDQLKAVLRFSERMHSQPLKPSGNRTYRDREHRITYWWNEEKGVGGAYMKPQIAKKYNIRTTGRRRDVVVFSEDKQHVHITDLSLMDYKISERDRETEVERHDLDPSGTYRLPIAVEMVPTDWAKSLRNGRPTRNTRKIRAEAKKAQMALF